MLDGPIPDGLTFDDVLLLPALSSVLPTEVDTQTKLTRNIALNLPIVSAAMDTVTESRLAIALAQQGGIGIIHRSMPVDAQAMEVDKVKRSESGMIVDPVTVSPESKIFEAQEIMKKYKISGVPVTRHGKLMGILTNRDLRFESRFDLPVEQVMTKENLITVPEGTTLEDAEAILHRHRVEKLLVVDDQFNLKGLITVKDIQKRLKYPNACKDSKGRLRVGAGLGATGDFLERAAELVRAKVDVLAIDTAHGHTARVMEAVRRVKQSFPDIDLIAGNVATFQGAADLIHLGVDGVKVGIGPGSICTTRVVTGAGVPQITAISECARAARESGVPHHRGRRHQVFRRCHQGHRRRRQLRDDRQPVCRNRREPGRIDPLPGAQLQVVPRNGFHRGHGGRLRRPLRPGSDRCPRRSDEAGAGRNRRPRALQRPPGRPRRPACGGTALRHGLLRVRHHRRTPKPGAFHPHHCRRPEGEPRSRCHHHQGSPQLLARLRFGRGSPPSICSHA